MKLNGKSIRTFIGAKDFTTSRQFYTELGFKETAISAKLSWFTQGDLGFYLQDYYVRAWVENSMILFESEHLEETWSHFQTLNLPAKYKRVRLTEIEYHDWGKVFYLHDPSGVLWHFATFHA